MRMKTKIIVVTCTLLSFFSITFAQEIITTQDMGVRASVGLNRELWKHYELLLLQEIRTNNNSTQIDKLITNVGLKYRIDKHFSLAGDLRYMYSKQEDTSYSNDIRYNFDFKFKHKIFDRYRFKYRMRYQQKFGNCITLDRDNINKTKTNFRNKFEIGYPKNNHLYYASAELFRKYEQYQKPHFNKVRYYLGTEFKYGKGKLDLKLGYENTIGDSSYPFRFCFIKTNYTFEFKN